jgi:hypothetical protein
MGRSITCMSGVLSPSQVSPRHPTRCGWSPLLCGSRPGSVVLAYRATGPAAGGVRSPAGFRALGFTARTGSSPGSLHLALARALLRSYRQPHAAHGHDGGAGGAMVASKINLEYLSLSRWRSVCLAANRQDGAATPPVCGNARSPCLPVALMSTASTRPGPCSRPGGPVSRLRPADHKGHAPDNGSRGYATLRSSQAPLSPLRRPFPALHRPAAAPA